jgi:hypothetical protein
MKIVNDWEAGVRGRPPLLVLPRGLVHGITNNRRDSSLLPVVGVVLSFVRLASPTTF